MKPLYEIAYKDAVCSRSTCSCYEDLREKLAVEFAYDFLKTEVNKLDNWDALIMDNWDGLIKKIDAKIEYEKYMLEIEETAKHREIAIKILETQKDAILNGGKYYKKLILGELI